MGGVVCVCVCVCVWGGGVLKLNHHGNFNNILPPLVSETHTRAHEEMSFKTATGLNCHLFLTSAEQHTHQRLDKE